MYALKWKLSKTPPHYLGFNYHQILSFRENDSLIMIFSIFVRNRNFQLNEQKKKYIYI